MKKDKYETSTAIPMVRRVSKSLDVDQPRISECMHVDILLGTIFKRETVIARYRRKIIHQNYRI